MESALQFLDRIKAEILQHPFLGSPFVEKFATSRPLPVSRARMFARFYYPHILRTRLYQANALGITPDENLQAVLADILYDEYGRGDKLRSHMQLYRNFMLAIGEPPSRHPDTDIIPELRDYIDTMMQLTQHGHWIAAVGAVGIASEWPIPHYYRRLLQGLQGIEGINAQDLELFSGHIELDLEHARMIEQALLPHLEETSGRVLLLEGIECNLNARMHLMTGLDRVVFS